MKENFQIHIWLGLLLCLLGMSCSDDTPAKGDDPGNGNTELEAVSYTHLERARCRAESCAGWGRVLGTSVT